MFKYCSKCKLHNALFCTEEAKDHPGQCCDCFDVQLGMDKEERTIVPSSNGYVFGEYNPLLDIGTKTYRDFQEHMENLSPEIKARLLMFKALELIDQLGVDVYSATDNHPHTPKHCGMVFIEKEKK